MYLPTWMQNGYKSINFRERTTNKIKSQHSVLKKHMDNEKSHLDKFVGIIDDIVCIQYT